MPENNDIAVSVVIDKEKRLQKLRKLGSDDPLLTKLKLEDEYLERYLNGTHYDVGKAFNKIKMLYETVTEYPEWFTKEAPQSKKELIEKKIRIAIPGKDKEGRPIYIAKLGNIKVDEMEILDVIAVDDMWLEYIFSDPSRPNGLCTIIDVGNSSLKLLKWLTPHNIKMGIKKLQTLPIHDYKFHVVNNSFILNAAMKLIWPFLPAYIKEVIVFHFGDRESLYKYIDPDELPEEYGGKYKKNIYDEQFEALMEKSDVIAESLKVQRTFEIVPI